MKLCLLFVAALVGVAMADDDCCSAEDRREIAFIWKRVWTSSFTDRKVVIAGAVFDEVFIRFPESRELFKGVKIDDPNSGEWRSHLVRVASGLDTIINLLEDPDVLSQQLLHLNKQHLVRTGVKKAYFDAVGDAFEKVLPQAATCFPLDAWHRCFRKMASIVAKGLP